MLRLLDLKRSIDDEIVGGHKAGLRYCILLSLNFITTVIIAQRFQIQSAELNIDPPPVKA